MYAQTVLGPIPAKDIGRTLMHEHILCDLRDPNRIDSGIKYDDITIDNRFQIDYYQNENQNNMVLSDICIAKKELIRYREAGGSTIVDLSNGGLSPQPEKLADISRASGVNIIIGGGLYVDSYMSQKQKEADIDEIETLIISQLRDGAWGTNVRVGIIGEIGCSFPLEDSERRSLIAAARAQKKTGAAITIHPGRNPDAPAEIAAILTEAGADPTRTIIGHMDRTIFDRERLRFLLNRGFVLEWDFFGAETSQYWVKGSDIEIPLDYMRLDIIMDLFKEGFRERVTISHDICSLTRLTSYGGHGYRHIMLNVVPIMKRRNWSEADIEQILVRTPSRLLAYLSDV